ncbi:MAG: sigma-70 family RNA polymerase sigma factor, partial [Anaerolineae bacterium]|nr:sigma-70 family RNA polymerase sigma factor [Phycisphaerae bacterium]
PRLPSDAAIAVWLHRTTRYACANARKMQTRREQRDRRTAALESTQMENAIGLIDDADEREQLLPLLDEAITQLGERDRSGLILCYFQRRTFREIGAMLGTSEEAARKRVTRSVDRIREYLLSRGVAMLSASPIIAAMVHESNLVAPATLVSSTTKLATVTHLAALAYPSAQIAQKVMHTMLMWKVKLATAACAAVVATSAVTATAIHQMSSIIAPAVVASSAVLATVAPESFEVQISDATTVQFLGIAKWGASDDEWFGIDGQKIEDPRGPWSNQQMRTREGMTHQAVVLVTSHGVGAGTLARIPKAKISDSFVLTPDAERAFWLIPFSIVPGATSVDIDILVADGEWKTVVTAEHTQVGRPAGGYETEVGGIAFTHVSENPRNNAGSVVYVAHEVKDQQFTVIAIDSQGNEHGCDDIYSDRLGGFSTARYEFGLPPDQIKSFVAKVRPYSKRVVAKNVTLDPAKPMKPEIEVIDVAKGK